MKYILGLLLWAHLSMGQTLKPKQEALIRNTIASQFGWEIANSHVLNLGRASFCKVGKDTLYNLAGFHYVFKLVGDSAIRLDKSSFHGIDNNRFLFTHNNKIYSLGGYGFFISHGTLKYFDKTRSEWLFQPTSGDIPESCNGITLKYKNTIYNFYNFTSGNNMKFDKKNSIELYKLDLEKFKWSKTKLDDKILNYLSVSGNYPQLFYLKDFTINLIDNYVLIFDLHTLQIYSVPSDVLNIHYNEKIIGINQNTIIYKNKVIEIKLNDIKEYLIDDLKGQHETFGYYSVSIIIFIIIIVLIVSLFYYKKHTYKNKKKEISNYTNIKNADLSYNNSINVIKNNIKESQIKNKTEQINMQEENDLSANNNIDTSILIKNENNNYDTFNKIYEALQIKKNNIIDINELDMILNINYLEEDSKRIKRHRLIRELNLLYPNTIIRVKDQFDKRKFNYKIN